VHAGYLETDDCGRCAYAGGRDRAMTIVRDGNRRLSRRLAGSERRPDAIGPTVWLTGP
jgi:hypothetical protein